jgi:hypothetical protein
VIDAHGQDNLDDDDDQFITARLATPNLAERLAASRIPLSTVRRALRARADGNFLYVTQTLRDIERDNVSFNQLDELPQGLNQWYEAWFPSLFPDFNQYAGAVGNRSVDGRKEAANSIRSMF